MLLKVQISYDNLYTYPFIKVCIYIYNNNKKSIILKKNN